MLINELLGATFCGSQKLIVLLATTYLNSDMYYQSWEPQVVAPKVDNTYNASLNLYHQSWEPQLVAPKIDNTYQTSLNMYHQSWEPQVVAPKHI